MKKYLFIFFAMNVAAAPLFAENLKEVRRRMIFCSQVAIVSAGFTAACYDIMASHVVKNEANDQTLYWSSLGMVTGGAFTLIAISSSIVNSWTYLVNRNKPSGTVQQV